MPGEAPGLEGSQDERRGEQARNGGQAPASGRDCQYDDRQQAVVDVVVEEALGLLRATLPATIEMRHDIGRDIGTLLADESQLQQVLINLTANAAHAMGPRGGVLEIKSRKVDVDTDFAARHVDLEPGPYVKLTVKDTGRGMTEEVMRRVFDPFYTTKPVGEGTGMGLAVVHGIVAGHGGAVDVASEPSKGTSFEIYLPLVPEADAAAQSERGPQPREAPLGGSAGVAAA